MQPFFHFIRPQLSFSGYLLLLACFTLPAFAQTTPPAERRNPTSKRANKAPVPKDLLPTPKKKAKKKKAKKKKAKKKFVLQQWLALGPALARLPAFHKHKQGKYTLRNFLTQRHLEIDRLWPMEGQKRTWFLSQHLTWKKHDGVLGKRQKKANVAYLATYLHAKRYVEVSLALKSHHRLRVFLDGRVVATKSGCTPLRKGKKHKHGKVSPKDTKNSGDSKKKTKKDKKDKKAKKTKTVKKAPVGKVKEPATGKGASENVLLLRLTKLLEQQNKIIQQQAKTIAQQGSMLGGRASKRKPRKGGPGKASATLRLNPGVHLLVVKALFDPKCRGAWSVKGHLKNKGKGDIASIIEAGRKPRERHSIRFMLNRKKIAGLSLSPNGREVIVRMRQVSPAGKSTYWLELRRVSDGGLLFSSRPHRGLYSLQWSPDGKYYSFATFARKKGTLWVVKRATGHVKPLLSRIHKLRFHTWAPNSKFLVYGTTHKAKPTKNEKAGAKRLRGMGDRWPWYRARTFLHAVTVDGTTNIRLTAGEWSTNNLSISSDSKRLLFYRNVHDYSHRPFSKNTLMELNLETMKVRVILDNLRWFNGAQYSPGGTKLLILGGPSLFGKLGHGPELPMDALANQYEKQAYIYDLKRREVEAITRRFSPSVRSAFWHPLDGHIYITALNRTRYHLYQYNTKTSVIRQIQTNVDVALRVQYARNSSNIVYVGSGLDSPGRLYTLDLWKPASRVLYAPADDWLNRLHLAKVKDWTTFSLKGVRLQGRIYYPPGFDPRKKYPMIVYYYGGTFPITRSFDGRYPFHLWAAHNFVVYVLQPSGAVGFGQKHAARHVNEWGSIVADEIIHATSQMLATHTFIDPKRVGCIGASYGGFMTMYLTTRTNMFAAAISHAGISNLTSYWGAGFWGFLYSSIATAKQYPWSHPKFYIKQSPLFSAHKVKTPLLLLHGDSDTNVPPSESYQMYTALRLLKRPVELVTFRKENHWILSYKQRIIWTNTIVAWFSKHLQKQPLWWKRLHGTKKH